jgi:hypothetical protein
MPPHDYDDGSNLARWLKLPDAARQPIENELDLYRRFAESAAPPPSETRKNLEHAASAADNLLELIEGFGPDEHSAFVEREGPTPRLDALETKIGVAVACARVLTFLGRRRSGFPRTRKLPDAVGTSHFCQGQTHQSRQNFQLVPNWLRVSLLRDRGGCQFYWRIEPAGLDYLSLQHLQKTLQLGPRKQSCCPATLLSSQLDSKTICLTRNC